VNREGLSPSRGPDRSSGLPGGWSADWAGPDGAGGAAGGGRTGHFEPVVLSLPPDLRSVGQARSRLAAAAAEWGCPEHLVDDARVVLSELMSNGVLHARTDLQVVMSAHGAGIRLEVRDASQTAPLPPLDVPRATASLMDEPHQAYLRDEERTLPTATGRGLAVVGALASSWGWYPEPGGGKVVWAELGTEPGAEGAAAHRSPDRVVYPVRPVRLVAAPLRLIKASEDHFDDLARELQMANLAAMAGADGAGGGPAAREGRLVVSELSPLAEYVKSRMARMREPLRRAMWEAARRGDRLVDLNLLADAGIPAVFEVFGTLLQKSEEAAERGFLLTGPPGPEVVAWRRWLRQELEDQIAGKPPRACPFPVTPVRDEQGGPGRERLDAARREALFQLIAVLGQEARADDGPGAAALEGDSSLHEALSRTIGYVGARRALLSLLGDDNETVAVGAHVGFAPDVVTYWRSTSLSADLPSSETIRTGRPLFFRTMAELDRRYPIFLSTPAESDPSIACVPLRSDGGPFGCLVLGFAQARDFSPGEASFLEQIADEFARHILDRRSHLARRLSAERDKAVAGAVAALAVAQGDQIWGELVGSVVACAADGASVHSVGENGTLSFVLARHRDPERAAAAVELLQRQARIEAGTDMLSECARTGEPAILQRLSEEAIAAGGRDDKDLVLLRKVGLGSLAMVPVRAGAKVVGVLSFANSVGRFISDEDLAAARRLTDEAGKALARTDRGT
jgi:GAF domain-containing protein/anti-sigma regulatory factor (Ser/Thr protein kinase)